MYILNCIYKLQCCNAINTEALNGAVYNSIGCYGFLETRELSNIWVFKKYTYLLIFVTVDFVLRFCDQLI